MGGLHRTNGGSLHRANGVGGKVSGELRSLG